MKLFKVSVQYDYVLAAESLEDAHMKAHLYAKDALSDCGDSVVDIGIEEYEPGSVDGWTGDLEPYGGDKKTDEYLEEQL